MSEADQTNAVGIAADQESKPKSFAAEEMITCAECLRANAPTRQACMYCGAALATTAAQMEVSPLVTANQQTISSGEGSYVVLIPHETGQIEESTVSQLASWLQVRATELQNALSAGAPLPLQLAKSADDAGKFADDARALGLNVVTVSESELNRDSSFRKIRALEICDDSLTGLSVTSGEKFAAAWNDIVLIVSGRLIATQLEVQEKRRGRQEPSDGRQISSDESVLDIWMRSDNTAWRIFVNSFDFSCLGSMKRLTAFENAKALLQIFRERAADAQINESYARMRPTLANVWPLEKQTRDSQLRHTGVGRRDFATVTTTDNQTQFNNYSRLLHRLRMRESDLAL
jgi:hypothetical protein